MRPDEERELLRHTERGTPLAEPEEPLLDRAHRLHYLDHRPGLVVDASVDDQAFREQPEAHREHVAGLYHFSHFFKVNHEAVLRKQDRRPFCRTGPGPAVQLYRLPGGHRGAFWRAPAPHFVDY